MLLLAALESWQQAGWEPRENYPLVLGTTAGGMILGEAYYRQALQQPHHHRGQAIRSIQYQAQVQARAVFDALGCSGPTTIISNACASGGNAIGHGFDLIRSGQAERVIAGGYDALGELVFSGFDSLQALSPTICRPFDAKRDGLALGEGAAILNLETLASARRRGAEILGEVIGYGTAIDQHHLTQPHPQGSTTLAVMKQACANARVTPEEIDYVNAHGTGTRAQRQFGSARHQRMGRPARGHAAGQFHESQHRPSARRRGRGRGRGQPDDVARTMAAAGN